MLDLDSARPEVRLQDLATAVHDFGKIYSAVGSEGHKVPLHLDRVAGLLRAYGQSNPLRAEEVQALPLLLAAARLKRALGRSARHVAGEQLSVNDLAKIQLEKARLDWLDRHRERLVEVLAAAARPAASR